MRPMMRGRVYQRAALHGSIAAVPLNAHTKTTFDPDGTPRCLMGLQMRKDLEFAHTYSYRARRFRCPLLHPVATAEWCPHPQFAKGIGCKKDINWEHGGLMRVLLDRS